MDVTDVALFPRGVEMSIRHFVLVQVIDDEISERRDDFCLTAPISSEDFLPVTRNEPRERMTDEKEASASPIEDIPFPRGIDSAPNVLFRRRHRRRAMQNSSDGTRARFRQRAVSVGNVFLLLD